MRYKFGNLLLSCLFVVNTAIAEEERTNLFGDWFGARESLSDSGIDVESILTADYIAGVDGGVDRDDTVLGNYDLTASVDTEKLGLWNGGSFFFYLLGNANSGKVPTDFVGDLQASDNIEADEAIKLYEAWYEHSFADDSVGVLVGLHDYNSEFYALDYAGGLINSSFGVGPDVSQVGPSIFATTALAARVRYSITDNLYALAALYDGVPGDPNNPRGTHIKLEGDDGIFYATEIGIIGEESNYYKLAVGGWRHTAKFEDVTGVERDSNGGVYVIGEKRLLSETDEAQGLGIFAQLGFSQESRNLVGTYIGGGVNYIGAIPSRDEDVISAGVARAMISDEALRGDEELESSETALEVNYRAQIAPYFALTPDFQYIVNPGAVRAVKDAVVLGVRAEVAM